VPRSCSRNEARYALRPDFGERLDQTGMVEVRDPLIGFQICQNTGRSPPQRISELRQGLQSSNSRG